MKNRSVKEILEMHQNWIVGNNGTRLYWHSGIHFFITLQEAIDY